MKHITRLKNDMTERAIPHGHLTQKDGIICEYFDAMQLKIEALTRQVSSLKRKGKESV